MIGETPICMKCIHYNTNDFNRFSCEAFPSGVPSVIIMSEFDHTKPYEDDNGIQFEPLNE